MKGWYSLDWRRFAPGWVTQRIDNVKEDPGCEWRFTPTEAQPYLIRSLQVTFGTGAIRYLLQQKCCIDLDRKSRSRQIISGHRTAKENTKPPTHFILIPYSLYSFQVLQKYMVYPSYPLVCYEYICGRQGDTFWFDESWYLHPEFVVAIEYNRFLVRSTSICMGDVITSLRTMGLPSTRIVPTLNTWPWWSFIPPTSYISRFMHHS